MKSYFLSKSDFKIAQNCPAKLYYKKHQYPTSTDQDEYMMMLADGGYMVGKMAQLLYPEGITIEGKTDDAIKETELRLKEKNVILFEAAIQTKNKLIRIDILEKKGNKLRLIEVKSKSFDSTELQLCRQLGEEYFKGKWGEYLEDIAYQKFVLQEKFPECKIESLLLLPDKAKTTPIEGLINWFEIKEVTQSATFRGVEIEFKGDINQLQTGHILELVNVDPQVEALQKTVKENSALYLKALAKDEKIQVPISCVCSGCEYMVRDSNHKKSGFEECWGKKANASPHILELGQLGNVNKKDSRIDDLISRGKSKLSDVPLEYVTKENGQPYYNNRPYYQLTAKKEFLLKDFAEVIPELKYPLHFIDFETSQMAIPYHKGMRPYGKVIFQWSCHTVRKPGAEPEHTEWINIDETYPNFRFAEALMKQLGNDGTLMTWSSYENSMLKDLYKSLEDQKINNPQLKNWLLKIAKHFDGDDTSIIDMNKLALKYYFHPNMGGRTSIKVTLPSVLLATKSKRIEKWLKSDNIFAKGENGSIRNPYELLPHIDIFDKAEKVKDGAGAMRAYQDMLYGKHKGNSQIKDEYKNALLRYCKLDTLAMVIIWEHWMDLFKRK